MPSVLIGSSQPVPTPVGVAGSCMCNARALQAALSASNNGLSMRWIIHGRLSLVHDALQAPLGPPAPPQDRLSTRRLKLNPLPPRPQGTGILYALSVPTSWMTFELLDPPPAFTVELSALLHRATQGLPGSWTTKRPWPPADLFGTMLLAIRTERFRNRVRFQAWQQNRPMIWLNRVRFLGRMRHMQHGKLTKCNLAIGHHAHVCTADCRQPWALRLSAGFARGCCTGRVRVSTSKDAGVCLGGLELKGGGKSNWNLNRKMDPRANSPNQKAKLSLVSTE